MTGPLTIERTICLQPRGRGGRQRLAKDHQPGNTSTALGRVPRLARLMALAIRFEGLISAGAVANYAELARLGHVTRARITQITNLLLLAPDIQEQILFLPPTQHGRDPIHLAHVQPIAAVAEWRQQRQLWAVLLQRHARRLASSDNPFEKNAQSA